MSVRTFDAEGSLRSSIAAIDRAHGYRAVKFFSKLNNFIFGYFDPINIVHDNKNKYFFA